MKPNCYIDFDGTLVSNKQRLYRFFIDHIPETYRNVLSEDDFWEIKRLGIHELDWIETHYHARIDKTLYNEAKKNEIETPAYLQYEQLLPNTIQALNSLRSKYQLILVSRRSYPKGLYDELERLEIRPLLDDICVIPHDNSTKAEHIRNIYNVSKDDVLVGDTEDDIIAGHQLGLKTYLVLSGIRREWIIPKYKLENIIVIPDISSIH